MRILDRNASCARIGRTVVGKNTMEKIIYREIKKCPYRHKGMVGKDRTEKYVICKLYCIPCLAVVEKGKCDALKELFKENENA